MIVKKILGKLRKTILQNVRETVLAKKYYKIIKDLKIKKKVKILDYGSGFEPEIILNLYKILTKNGFNPEIICCDFYNLKQLSKLNNNKKKIKFINLKNLKNIRKFDISIISDVLHHVDIEKKEIDIIFNKLKKNSKFIILKDQFETGFISRSILRIMDFIGNYYNDVEIPKKYFTKHGLEKKLKILKIKIYKKFTSVSIYPKYFLFFSNPKLQFIYILSK